ncbi:MAG: hypothetical protein Kow0037_18460 [Calditrichia bacterium]
MKPSAFYKKCPKCGAEWGNLTVFLADDTVQIIGYQANFTKLKGGLFLFNHDCETTFSVKVEAFQELYDGPIYQKRATLTDQCPAYCFHQEILESCEVDCECAFVREILRRVKDYAHKNKQSV